MPTLREFQSRRPANRILYHTITFYHPSFGYKYFVANQIKPLVFEGQEFMGIRMEVVPSQQSNTPVITASVRFSRIAADFKQTLKLWQGSSRLTPITALYRRYDSSDMNTPLKPWSLFVDSVTMDESDVTVSLTIKNPMNNNVAVLYKTSEFPGLKNV